MRYHIRIPYQDEKQFMEIYTKSDFFIYYYGRDIDTGIVSIMLELPNCSDRLEFLRKILTVAGGRSNWGGNWLSRVETLCIKEHKSYEESTAKFLESFSKEMEAASKKILKEEEEQKAKEEEEQRAKEEEDQKLKEIKDEEDAKLTALISYFYNRN